MPKKERDEFEILLGNKQLLSVFFIVVILLGVFFTMGYTLGRSSSGAADSAAQETRQGLPAGGTQQKVSPASGYAPVRQPGPPHVETSPPPAEPAVAAAPATEPPASLEPRAGATYLQVMAVKKPEADVVADVLKRKGFRSLVAAHPSEPVFRVLVGPLADADAVVKTRAALIEAGFNKSVVRTY